jgi:hypothetical protein
VTKGEKDPQAAAEAHARLSGRQAVTADDARSATQNARVREAQGSEEMKFHAEQERIGAELRGETPDDPRLTRLRELDGQWRDNWVAMQRRIYPDLYRVGDERLALGGEPSAQPGAPMGLFSLHAIGMEPGHDPTAQARYREWNSQAGGWDIAPDPIAGVDNIPPGDNRVTTVPTTAGSDSSVTQDSVEDAKAEENKGK